MNFKKAQIDNTTNNVMKTSKIRNSRFLFIAVLAMITIIGKSQVSFISNGQNITSSNAWDIHLVDLNGDSIPDAYFENKVWLNDGHGQFTKTNTSFGSGTYTSFADINGDGYVDVVCNDSIFLNDSAFHFNFSKKLVSDIIMLSSVLADIDNDGDIDIISCSDATDRILLNDGKGNFTNTGKSLDGWGQASYALGDINGDGFTDIYVAIPHIPPMGGHTPNLIWFGDSAGNFTKKLHDISGAESRGAILADFNKDGKLELYVSDRKTGGKFFFNDGAGNFTISNQQLGTHASMAVSADFNNDGYLDIFIGQDDGNSEGAPFGNGAPNTVWINDGTGHFTDSHLRLGSSNSIAVAVGDINNDNKKDVIVANVKFSTPGVTIACPVEIWLNNSIPTAIKPIYGEYNDVAIYPNPCKELVNVKFNNPSDKPVYITMFDLQGNIVIAKTMADTENPVLDLTGFSNGTYLVSLSSPDKVIYKMIYKE